MSFLSSIVEAILADQVIEDELFWQDAARRKNSK